MGRDSEACGVRSLEGAIRRKVTPCGRVEDKAEALVPTHCRLELRLQQRVCTYRGLVRPRGPVVNLVGVVLRQSALIILLPVIM